MINPIDERDLVKVILRHSTGVTDPKVAERVATEVMIFLRSHVLTEDERLLLGTLSKASAQFHRLISPVDSPANRDEANSLHDWSETARTLHDLQVRVMAVAAARIYPNQYRSLVTRE